MSPLTGKMYNIHILDDALAELSHFYNNKQIGTLRQGLPIPGTVTDKVYTMPFSMEHTTHTYTQPLLEAYITQSDKGQGVPNSPEEINDRVNGLVRGDLRGIFRKSIGGQLQRSIMPVQHRGLLRRQGGRIVEVPFK